MTVCGRWGAIALAFCAWTVCAPGRAAADGYGAVTGQFVLDGPLPNLKPLVAKGDSQAKDAAVCGMQGVPDESLVVDPETRGIANVFFYMPKAPADIYPDLKESKDKLVKFDQHNCRFIPHAMIVRTDQTVAILSADTILHNTDVHPFRNSGQNQTISLDRVGTTQWRFPEAERMPISVKCDIHPWMQAWWLIVDHPYAAISGKDGTFTIQKVPAGTHKFVAWQDVNNGRWVLGKTPATRVIRVQVKANETTRLPVFHIPAAELEKK